MGFFDNEDVIDLTQTHIKKIGELEEKEAKRLIRRYKEIRQDLRDRLDTVPGDTFTAQQLRGVLIQVEAAIDSMQKGLVDDIGESSKKAAILGSENLIRETQTFNEIFSGAATNINVNAALIATDTSNFLFNQYETSIDSYSGAIRSSMARTLSQAVIEQANTTEIISRMGKFLLGEEWKLRQLARTELHSVYNLARQNTLFQVAPQIPKLQKTLFHPMDDRTGDDSKQAKQANLIVDIDKPFKYTYVRYLKNGEKKTENRVFMTPPDRPGDRSILVPYSELWDE